MKKIFILTAVLTSSTVFAYSGNLDFFNAEVKTEYSLDSVEINYQSKDACENVGKILEKIAKPLFKSILKADLDSIDDNFFSNTDFLSINNDYRKSNIEYINEEYVGKFKKNIYIVNTSRGEVVDEGDIVKLLYDGKLLGYGTDVIQEEHTSKATVLKCYHDNRIFITT